MQISLPTNEPYIVRDVVANDSGQRITSGIIERDGVDEHAVVIEWLTEDKLDIVIKGFEYEEYYL